MSKKYKHLFFDLDHTLWDHQRNANETLADLFLQFKLHELGGFSVERFQEVFHVVNHELWDGYHTGLIDQKFIRTERFKQVLQVLGVQNYPHYPSLGHEYLHRCPRKSNLMPHTIETLDYLKASYPMTIITNGFDEIQGLKLSSSGISRYFDLVITSGQAGCLKPHRGIFDFALDHAAVNGSECIMIGDNPVTDISGARDAGIDQIYYNSRACEDHIEPTYKIGSLQELKELL